MTIYTHTLIAVIPAPIGNIGAAVASMLDPDTGGAESFAIHLSATGKTQATHLAMSMPCSEGDYMAAQYLFAQPEMLLASIERDFALRFPDAALPTLAEIEGFCGQSAIADGGDVGAALADNGLQIVRPVDA